MRAPQKPDWIALDWGTSNMRAWAISNQGAILDHATSDQGMGGLTPDQFEPVLLDTIRHWLTDQPMPIIACGMLGARQGWVEAAYGAVPCPALSQNLTVAPTTDPRLTVHIIPGLSQSDPADVMRGEETQIAGYLAQNPDFDGVICLPGTHSKWAHVSAGEVVSFRTFMTGEMFSLLAKNSVLRHSIADQGWDEDAFLQTLDATLSRPEQLAAKLFSLRAESLLNDQSGDTARAKLSALLIGAELAAAKPYWLGQPLALIGAPALTRIYAAALQAQGASVEIADVTAMTLAGLAAIYKSLESPT